MKHHLFLLALIVSTTTLFAETVKLNGLYYSLGTTTAQVVQDQSSDKSVYSAYTTVTIPASVTYNNYTYSVTSIGTSAFEALTNLQSVTLPTSVTAINQDAFYGCTRLANVNLPEGLTTIGQRAFYNCNLTEITIPSTVTSIGNAAFKGNPTTTIVWKPTNCTIGSDDNAPFYSTNSQVTSFTFADGVETVPAYLCKYMNRLESIDIPASVTSIGQSAFMYCTNLKAFEFPQGIKTVATSVLEGCTALEEVVIPSSVTTINQDAFYNCSALQAIRNYAYTPQTITERTVYDVNKHTCILYVPMDYIVSSQGGLVRFHQYNRRGHRPAV